MPTHRMHLKGPWDYRIESSSDTTALALQPAGKVKLPQTWVALFGDLRAVVQFRRRFHTPTNLDPHERVFVVFDGIGGATRIQVNDHVLDMTPDSPEAETCSGACDITSLLRPNNDLVVLIDGTRTDDARRGLWGPVALEIRDA